jgi:hypothetical protein
MLALLVVAVALGLNNFGAAIAIGVSGVDRRTEIKVATVFGLCDVVMPAAGMLIGRYCAATTTPSRDHLSSRLGIAAGYLCGDRERRVNRDRVPGDVEAAPRVPDGDADHFPVQVHQWAAERRQDVRL